VVGGRRYVVGRRWQVGQKGRFQVSVAKPGFRSQNEEHLLSAFCLLLTADRLLYLGKEKNSNFKKCRTDTGMSMKTKDRCGNVARKRECL
jgi:hypothetical protein